MLVTPAEVREHVETDRTDEALTLLIADAEASLIVRYGPNYPGPVTLTRFLLDLSLVTPTMLYLERPAESIASVTEFWGDPFNETETVLGPADYRLHYGGRALERLGNATNPRWLCGHRVVISYVPVDDMAQRRRICIDLVKLALRYNATKEVVAGDTREYAYDDYTVERANLLDELAQSVAFA